MKQPTKKPTATEKLKAENAALLADKEALLKDIWTMTMSTSIKDMTAVSIKWKLIFEDSKPVK